MSRFKTVSSALKAFAKCQSGATAIEYSFIALLVGTSVVAGATTIGENDMVTLNAVTNVWPE